MGGDKKKKRKVKSAPARSLKKHTRSLKETGIIYAIGSVISIYFGLLCGAVWMSGNSFNEFLINFNDFILVKQHFIVGSRKRLSLLLVHIGLCFLLSLL